MTADAACPAFVLAHRDRRHVKEVRFALLAERREAKRRLPVAFPSRRLVFQITRMTRPPRQQLFQSMIIQTPRNESTSACAPVTGSISAAAATITRATDSALSAGNFGRRC